MDPVSTVASVAALSGLGAYLNAKYHLVQDVKALKFRRSSMKYYEELGESILRMLTFYLESTQDLLNR